MNPVTRHIWHLNRHNVPILTPYASREASMIILQLAALLVACALALAALYWLLDHILR